MPELSTTPLSSTQRSSTQRSAEALSRRAFLATAGALVVSFNLPGARAAGTAGFTEIAAEQLDSWLAIAADGSVTVFTGRIEMGTGVQTVYAQVVAEELDVPMSAVTVVMGDTARTPEQGKSTASDGVALNAPPLRQAAAEARLKLLELASAKLGVPPERLVVTDGVVSVAGRPAATASYASLIGGKRFDVALGVSGSGNQKTLKGRATPKDPSRYKLVGRSVPRLDIPAKVMGEFDYVHDVKVEGMLHGAVVRPAELGAALVSVDGFATPVPGVVKIVTRGNFVGIVAETERGAAAARRALKVTWSKGKGLPAYDEVYDAVRSAPVVWDEVWDKGSLEDAFSGAAKTVDATYNLPFNSHGMMGPSCAIADFRGDRLTIWSGTQWPDGTRSDIAQMLGLPKDNVRVIWVEGAGSYGRLGVDDAAADAALLSQAVGRPVRVQWQRDDEHGWSPFNPGAVIRVRASLDKSGSVTGLDYQDWTASHSTGERGNQLAWRLAGGNPGHKRLSGGADPPAYEVPNSHVATHYTEELLRAIYMRSVGGIQNIFAVESTMDELAHLAGADPIEFRLRHLGNERMKAALRAAATLANWQPGAPPGVENGGAENGAVLSGRGVAIFDGRGYEAYIATIVDVEIDKASGAVRVKRAYVGFDAGKIMNPDGMRNQIEGGTIMGISRALKEEVRFDRGKVTTVDWASYPVLRFTEAPEAIDIALIDSANPPLGAGEPPNVPPAAAIANAIFAATGVRIRALPFTPDRIKAAFSV